MTTLATTNLALPRLRMMELLAACPHLQSALPQYDSMGHLTSPTPTTAMLSIYSPYADDHFVVANDPTSGLVNPRPRVIIQHNDYARQKLGTAYGASEGSLFVTFEFKPDPAAGGDLNKELALFEESLGLILDDMESHVGADKVTSGAGIEVFFSDPTSTHLNITKYALVAGPASSFPEEELGETFYAAVFLMDYIG